MDPAALSLPFDEETPDAVAGEPLDVVLVIMHGEIDQANKPFRTTGQEPIEPQKPLAVLTERVQSHINGSSIGPKRPVASVANLFFLPVTGGITPKEYGQMSSHAEAVSTKGSLAVAAA